MTLGSLLFARTERLDELAIASGDVQWTWSRLQERAVELREAAQRLGAAPGAPVAVMLPNGPDLVATLFGVWAAGAVYVPLNPRLTDTEIARIVDQVSPALIVTTSELRRRVGSRPALLIDDGALTEVRGVGGNALFEGDVALIQFTSGTTGPPKAVLLTHSGVLELIDGVLGSIRSGASSSKPRAPMPNIVPMSLALWAGIYNVLFAFRTGAPVVIMATFDPVEFAAIVARFQIRSSVLPPAAIAMLAADERIESLAPLKFVRSVTAPLSPLQARRFRDRFAISVLNGYGQTEIGGEIVGWNAMDSRRFGDAKLGSVGRPHAGVEVYAEEATGELCVRTPALSAGYLDGSDLGDRIDGDGWFHTGDVGHIDEDGFVWIDGRVSDMINRGGLKVHPGEVEEVLLLAPAVAEAAVVGEPDDRLGEVPVAFVVPRTSVEHVDPDELERLCRTHLAAYKIPVRINVVAALPRSEIGKLQRNRL